MELFFKLVKVFPNLTNFSNDEDALGNDHDSLLETENTDSGYDEEEEEV